MTSPADEGDHRKAACNDVQFISLTRLRYSRRQHKPAQELSAGNDVFLTLREGHSGSVARGAGQAPPAPVPAAPYFLKVYGFGSSTALSQVSPACPRFLKG